MAKKPTTPSAPPLPGAIAAAPDVSILAALDRYGTRGRNADLLTFEQRMTDGSNRLRSSHGMVNIWKFIEDACEGTGGFSDGSYLVPFRMELESETGLLGVSRKYAERQALADYDRFAGHIAAAPWDLISTARDLIRRDTEDERISAFWEDCDGNGTHVMDFLAYPHLQARRYGTGIIVMDRPAGTLANLAEDTAPENRPRVYSVPTYYVHDWKFSKRGRLTYVVIAEPEEDQTDVLGAVTVRIWTETAWALCRPLNKRGRPKGADDFQVLESGLHEVGRVPVVLYRNDPTARGRFLAPSEMFDVAKKGQTYFNLESEAREIQRKSAAPILTMGVESTKDYDAEPVVIGADTVLVHDGKTPPAWISPDLSILEEIRSTQTKKKAESYADAGLSGLMGNTQTSSGGGSQDAGQTSSGFHAQVVFSRTETRVGRHAGSAEETETDLVLLLLAWYGETAPRQELKKTFTVTYPRNFGIADLDAMLKRTSEELAVVKAPSVIKEILTDYLRARFPRKSGQEIDALVQEEMRERKAAESASAQLQRMVAKATATTQPKTPPAPGVKPAATAPAPPAPVKGASNAKK